MSDRDDFNIIRKISCLPPPPKKMQKKIYKFRKDVFMFHPKMCRKSVLINPGRSTVIRKEVCTFPEKLLPWFTALI